MGLIPTGELAEVNALFAQLAELASVSFDWESLLPLLKVNTKVLAPNPCTFLETFPSLSIAIAQDQAFNFYYADNLNLLEKMGAKLIPWSPLKDSQLPANVTGLYFGGGFPEVFGQQLSENHQARQAVSRAITRGMPTYAECGGLMYLCKEISDFDEKTWEMVGVLPTQAYMSGQLTIGYRQAIAQVHSPFLAVTQTVWGHEFHRSKLNASPLHPVFKIKGLDSSDFLWVEGWSSQNLHASYVHLHFGGAFSVAQNFLERCLDFSQKGGLD